MSICSTSCLQRYAEHSSLNSFPTRRSSDLRMAVAHTRYAVLGEDDEPIGVVHLLDVLGSSSTPDEPVVTIMRDPVIDRKSTRLNSSHVAISYAVFCLKKKTDKAEDETSADT